MMSGLLVGEVLKDSSEDLGMTGGVAALEAEIQKGMAELREMLL